MRQAQLPPAFHTAKKMSGTSRWFEATKSTESPARRPRRRSTDAAMPMALNSSTYVSDRPVDVSVCAIAGVRLG